MSRVRFPPLSFRQAGTKRAHRTQQKRTMKYVNLGRSGLKVSRICLGCMSYGLAERNWHLQEEQSRPFIQRALESGINFFDTANMYGAGASETVLGRALREVVWRGRRNHNPRLHARKPMNMAGVCTTGPRKGSVSFPGVLLRCPGCSIKQQ